MSTSAPGATLVDYLAQVPDFRRKQGLRFPLPSLLVMIILAVMSGHYAYREIARFLKANQRSLVRHLGLQRDEMPSHVTIRTVLMGVDFHQVNKAFSRWASDQFQLSPGDWLAVDAKAIASTVAAYDSAQQDFVSLVSAFSHQQGLVVASARYQNKHTSEVAVTEELIVRRVERLGLRGVTFTLDALHCKKRRSSASSTAATTT